MSIDATFPSWILNYAKKIHKINFFLFSEYKPDIVVEDSTFEYDMKQFFMSEMLSDINFRVQNKYLRGKSSYRIVYIPKVCFI